MSAQHTPGPWRYETPDEVSIKDADGGRVAILTNLRGALGMGGRRDPNEVTANARLIAAAPELLDALIQLEGKALLGAKACDAQGPAEGFRVLAEYARAAIAKAQQGGSK